MSVGLFALLLAAAGPEAVVDKFLSARDAGDVATWSSLLADDVRFRDALGGTSFREINGRDEAVRFASEPDRETGRTRVLYRTDTIEGLIVQHESLTLTNRPFSIDSVCIYRVNSRQLIDLVSCVGEDIP